MNQAFFFRCFLCKKTKGRRKNNELPTVPLCASCHFVPLLCDFFSPLRCAPSLRHSAVLTDFPSLEIKSSNPHDFLEMAEEADNTSLRRTKRKQTTTTTKKTITCVCSWNNNELSEPSEESSPSVCFSSAGGTCVSAPRSCPPLRKRREAAAAHRCCCRRRGWGGWGGKTTCDDVKRCFKHDIKTSLRTTATLTVTPQPRRMFICWHKPTHGRCKLLRRHLCGLLKTNKKKRRRRRWWWRRVCVSITK